MRFIPQLIASLIIALSSISDANTWESYTITPEMVNSNSIGLPQICSDPDGKLYLIYPIYRDSSVAIFFQKAGDSWNTFSDTLSVWSIENDPNDPQFGIGLSAQSMKRTKADTIMAFYAIGSFGSQPSLELALSFDDGAIFIPSKVNFQNFGYQFSFLERNEFIYLFSSNLNLWMSDDHFYKQATTTQIDSDSLSGFPYTPGLAAGEGDTLLLYWLGHSEVSGPVNIYTKNISLHDSISSPSKRFDPQLYGSENLSVDYFENHIFYLHMSFTELSNISRIIYTGSDDFGRTLSNKKILFEYNEHLYQVRASALRYNPKIGICVLINAYSQGLLFTRSTDNGINFSPLDTVTSNKYWTSGDILSISDSGDIYIAAIEEKPSSQLGNITIFHQRLVTGIKESVNQFPDQNTSVLTYPNPFNQTVTILVQSPYKENIEYKIYDIRGREIFSSNHNSADSGTFRLTWYGCDQYGKQLASGLYLLSLKIGSDSFNKKLLLIR